MRVLALAALLLSSMALAAACNRGEEKGSDAKVSAAPKPNELPPLELRDDTANLLLTWIDDKGDFHVVQKIGDVPEGTSRKAVRVVVTTREEGTGKVVYVADLSQKSAAGTYPVSTMTRAEWDEKGATKRSARLEALAPGVALPPGSASGAPTGSAPAQKAADGRVVAIIYGADWCKPCHDAARYLKQRGVTVVEKDIEENEVARQEMLTKLKRAGMPPSASIPIIDVMGQLMVGFDPRGLERAIQTAESAKPL